MTLIVQNDAGTVTNANTYADLSFASSYFSDVGDTTWSGLTSTVQEYCLKKAMRYLEMIYYYQWRGIRSNSIQNTAFPRREIFELTYTDYVEITGIPLCLKQSQCEYARFASQNDLTQTPDYSDAQGIISSETISTGDLSTSTTYLPGSAITIKSIPEADFLLSPLLEPPLSVFRF